jgi:DNA-directed RNA polymerase specialized sigma24 family protein
MSPEEAIAKPYEPKAKKVTAVHDGEEKALTFKEWAAIHGVHPDRIHQRIHQGMPRERAVTKPFDGHRGKFSGLTKAIVTAQWEGEERTLSVKEWSEITGIAIGTIRFRVKNLKWSYEKAVITPIQLRKAKT